MCDKVDSKSFNKSELLNLMTSNFFSILYYNADIWLIPSLNPRIKQQHLSASASALIICIRNFDWMISFDQLHYMAKRVTPTQIMNYKHALLLFKIYNGKDCERDWIDLNFNQNFNRRSNLFNCIDTSLSKIGKNIASNRIRLVNGKIPFDWLNLTLNSYKIKTKELLLKTF